MDEPRKQDAPGREGGSVTWLAVTTVLAAFALVLAYVSFAFGGPHSGSDTSSTAEQRTVDVELSEMKITPASIEVPSGTVVTFNVTNKGTLEHDFKVGDGEATPLLSPGQSTTVTSPALTTSTKAICTVPGHEAAGMVMTITVTGSTSSAQTASAQTASPYDPNDAVIDFSASPPEGWTARDPVLAPAEGGTTHDITMHATEVEMEVAPGVTQQMWTFENQVPGPILHGKVGDVFNITLVNDGTLGHSIDFHASKVAWNDEMRTIKPGESLVYQFQAGYAGAFMYHCGTAPTLHHIGNGMYGAIIIDPPELAPVDHEYVFVQSEIYTGPQGEPGDLNKMQDDAWDAVVFNGYVSQYKHSPIRVEPNERVRAWVIDDGPSENSAFHVVGTVFDTVWKEGSYLLRPDATTGGSQVLDLQPAQGGFVEFSLAEVGLYPMVTHKFSNPGKGAIGLFQAGEVDTTGVAGH